jgi:NDP-sugar pyrophosphorylase family protein
MKALLLAGGFGTRLRPLTLNTPKPIVPIFDRPFLFHQIDVLKRLPEIDEVILSLNHQAERIRALVEAGADPGLPLRYLVEPSPRGTGGAVKYAEPHLDGTTIVFNGDVLTSIDLPALVRLHRE